MAPSARAARGTSPAPGSATPPGSATAPCSLPVRSAAASAPVAHCASRAPAGPIHPAWPVLALTFNAGVWGLSWLPFRHLQGQGLHPLWATCMSYAAAALVLMWRYPRAWREVLQGPGLWVVVLAAGFTNAAFNWAVSIGDVVRVVLLFYLMPLWAVGLGWWLLGERPGALDALRVALALGGAAVVLWPAGGGWPLPRSLPEGLGLAGGLSFALNNVMLRREARRSGVGRALAMFGGSVAAAAGLGAVLGAAGQVPWPAVPGPAAAALVLALGAVFLASNLALQFGAARLPAGVTAVVMLVEVLVAAASSAWLGGAVLLPATWLGGALIVTAAVLSAWPRRSF